jgi:hypothetical protein
MQKLTAADCHGLAIIEVDQTQVLFMTVCQEAIMNQPER